MYTAPYRLLRLILSVKNQTLSPLIYSFFMDNPEARFGLEPLGHELKAEWLMAERKRQGHVLLLLLYPSLVTWYMVDSIKAVYHCLLCSTDIHAWLLGKHVETSVFFIGHGN
jgi:hypothetical protein